jgi:mRNA interferase MazF
MRKTRPCVVVSPDELNDRLQTVVIVPMTSTVNRMPQRLELTWRGRSSSMATDQLRAVDRERIRGRLGSLEAVDLQALLTRLQEMFAP